METIRSFIALEISAQIQKELGRIQAELKKANADVKWADPEGIHLTLKFLGNVSMQLIEEVKKVVAGLAKEHHCFSLTLGRLGAFPTAEHPRVIWVGLDQGKEQSVKLAQDLEERLLILGFLKEKRGFKPHLTLGRVRSASNRHQLKQPLISIAPGPISMQAKTLTLFKSTLTSAGAIYEPLHTAELKPTIV